MSSKMKLSDDVRGPVRFSSPGCSSSGIRSMKFLGRSGLTWWADTILPVYVLAYTPQSGPVAALDAIVGRHREPQPALALGCHVYRLAERIARAAVAVAEREIDDPLG